MLSECFDRAVTVSQPPHWQWHGTAALAAAAATVTPVALAKVDSDLRRSRSHLKIQNV